MTEADASGAGWERIADGLAAFLAELHAVSVASLEPPSLARANPAHLAELWTATAPALRHRLTADEFARTSAWWDELLGGHSLDAAPISVTHGDPWWENLTIDDCGLAGVLDWEFLSLSDPANDIGVTGHMGEAFFSRVVHSYFTHTVRHDPTIEDRARMLHATRVFYGIQFAIDREDEAEWTDALLKLRAGPILAGNRA